MIKDETYYSNLDKRTAEYKDWKSEGLGDTVEKIIKATGLNIFTDGKDCGCEDRKKKLNEIFPYRFKARCMSEIEYSEWKEFRSVRRLQLDGKQVLFITNLFADLFSRKRQEICGTCSAKPILKMINKIDKVYETYK